eukprot:GSChrysophyteH1.ASY1.ANO1.720.1 assembled CDS
MVQHMEGKGIVVTINYRLGALGFLGAEQLRQLDPENGSTGNMGIQDQRLAFQWVQENIGAFGGDKSKVMIFGESAGAGSMTMHSGAFSQWNMQPMSHAQTSYESFSSAAGCDVADLTCLQALTLDEIHTAFKTIPFDLADAFIFGPTVDGVEATVHSWVAAANGDVNRVPVMFGTNRDEGSMFCDLKTDATMEDVSSYWAEYGGDVPTLTALYIDGKSYPDVNNGATVNWWAGMRSLGDDAMSCPANYAAQQLHTKQPVYQYFFEHVSKYATKNDGLVIHGSELPFVLHTDIFGNIKDRKMCDMMASYWANFLLSETGDPNEHIIGSKLLPQWPRYTEDNPAVLNVVEYDDTKPVLDLKKAECDYWIPFVDQAIRAAFQ